LFKLQATFLLLFILTVSASSQSTFKRYTTLMGCDFDITVVAEDSIVAEGYIKLATDEISRIEKLISSWDANSQTSLINQKAGINPVVVDRELFDLIDRAIGLSHITDGAFDITYASMDNIWKFDGSMTHMPSVEEINSSVANVGYQNIKLNKQHSTVYLERKGMKIGFGAIGKGYAADRAKALLMSKGVTAGIINASGDMNTWGRQIDGSPWKVAITNPLNKAHAFGLLPISDAAVVTSGSYEKHVTFDDKRYAHIIDPRTGYPTTGLMSVTVFAPMAELADALATSVFVMGKDAGLDRINQMNGIECILIDDHGNIFTSDNLEINKE
jgi:thiamine biosynthesis lipoprotein